MSSTHSTLITMADRTELRTWSFLALVVGGVLILLGALMGTLMMGAWGGMRMGSMSSMMNAYIPTGWAVMTWWMTSIGLVTGGLVLLSAYRVYREREVGLWSVVAIVAGALSLFAMGGWIVGAASAIAGGALALADQSQKNPRAGGA